MGILTNYIIIKYKIPSLGEYLIDESLDIYHNGKVVGTGNSIPESKNLLKKIIEGKRSSTIQKKQAEIRELQDLSSTLDTYRIAL